MWGKGIKNEKNRRPSALKIGKAEEMQPKGSPKTPWGTVRGGQGGAICPLKGAGGAPRRAYEGTFGRNGDFTKSLFLLHEIVHFDSWMALLATPESTKRTRAPEKRA